MTFLDSDTFLYVAFIVVASIEQYFFMMQRSALEISRAEGIDVRDGRRMLPLWYIMVWPVTISKWAAAIYIGMHVSWLIAVMLLAVAFLFSVFVPIPHQQFIPLFRHKIAKEMGDAVNTGSGSEAKFYANLYKRLFDASKDSRFN